jgi:hypothetical protein
MKSEYPVTPDGRYFVVKGRLWRCTNPSLPADTRQRLVGELMQARRAKGEACAMRTRWAAKQRGKGPVDTLMVDHLERPTENLSEATRAQSTSEQTGLDRVPYSCETVISVSTTRKGPSRSLRINNEPPK